MKIHESQRFLGLFCMLGFLVGIIYANVVSEDYIGNMGVFNEFFLNQYMQMDIDELEYIWYLIQVRVIPLGLLCALGCTKLRRAVVAAFLLWTGFSCGMIMTSAVLKMGVKGIILCLIALTPHIFFYIGGYVVLIWYLYTYPLSKWNLSKTISMMLFIAVGVLLECYVNPVIMQAFLKTL